MTAACAPEIFVREPERDVSIPSTAVSWFAKNGVRSEPIADL